MIIFKGSQVIKYYVMFAFLFVQTVVQSHLERSDTFELLGVFNEGMIGLLAYCSAYFVF